jgi:hypothetical protein
MEPVLLAAIVLGVAVLLAACTVAWALLRPRLVRGPASLDQPSSSAAEAQTRRDIERLRDAIEALAARLDRVEDPLPPAKGRDPGADLPSASPPAAAAQASRQRDRAELRSEIGRLAARGRDPLEIAQLLDAPVGEVELVLQLGRITAPGETRSPAGSAGPRS